MEFSSAASKMLNSFVAPKDYTKLIALMLMVKHDVLKEKYRIIVIHGSGNNGKTVFSDVLHRLSPSNAHVAADLFRRPANVPSVNHMAALSNASLVTVGEPYYEDRYTYIDDIDNWYRLYNGNIIRPKLHSFEKVVLNSGVFLVNINTKPKYIAKRVIEIEFPNVFKYDENLPPETIVDQCVKEFEQMNFNTPNIQFNIYPEQHVPIVSNTHEEITDKESKLRNLYAAAYRCEPGSHGSDPWCPSKWYAEDVYKIIIYPRAVKAAINGEDFIPIPTNYGIDKLINNYFENINKLCKKDGLQLSNYPGFSRNYRPYIYSVTLEFV